MSTEPDALLTRAGHRLAAALRVETAAALCALAVVALADGWRTALLAAAAAAALAATRIRYSGRTALCLLLIAALLALGGWGPGFDERSPSTVAKHERGADR